MNEAAYLAVRLAFLALLWLFVLSAVRAVRADLFGPTRRQQRRTTAPRASAPPPPPRNRRGKAPSKLVVTAGTLRGTTIPLGNGALTIGRAGDSTLVLDDDFASSHHARLVPSDGHWLVEDLGSTNGTYLDRTKVTRPTPVPLGAPVRIGKTVMELRR
jgi:pSer/pThr/pTyr-binding forkhead associated (FHA) protein